MSWTQDAPQRLRNVRCKVLRRTVGSLRYLFLLSSLLLPSLAFTTQGAELLGSYQIPIGVALYIPPVILAVLLVKNQKRILNQRLAEQAVCPKCYYDLTGTESGVCPECGNPRIAGCTGSEPIDQPHQH